MLQAKIICQVTVMTGNSPNCITKEAMMSRIPMSEQLHSRSAADNLYIVIQISFLLKNRYLL